MAASGIGLCLTSRGRGVGLLGLFVGIAVALSAAVPGTAVAASYYVAPAPAGSDSNDGSMGSPWATISRAHMTAAGGDTVFFRAGNYVFTAAATACGSQTSTVNVVAISRGGSAAARVNYWAFPGEVPVFDFSGVTNSCRITGVRVTGSWIHFKGLEIKGVPQNNMANHESWGVWVSGSNNIFETLHLHHNMGPGLFIQGGTNNLVLNCDSHHNYDAMSSTGPGTNADGFGSHGNSTGNVFRGCRAWFNGDDGWDFIRAQNPVVVENSWAWSNGYQPDSTAAAGDGNGFKAGGFGLPPTEVPANPPQHTVRFCLAFANRAAGFYANHHPVEPSRLRGSF